MKVVVRGTNAATLATSGGYGLYAGALSGADVLHRVDADGLEDFVAFATAPADEFISYDLDFSGVAGLRLVENVVELLDAGGVPRLRVASPWVIDAAGRRSAGTLAIDGCAYDTSPAAPWSRPVTAPGAEHCSVTLRWHAASYPALVDPHWTTTGAMAYGRAFHVAEPLANGDVLVTGGRGGPANSNPALYAPLTETELFHAATSTFTMTGPLATGRLGGVAVKLASNKVIVIGGGAATTELYDAALGTWMAGPSMSVIRSTPAAAVLVSGKVLVVGGTDGATVYRATAELYDPVANLFASTGTMAIARSGATAIRLTSGKVLVIGGDSTLSTGTALSELYDPATGAFATSGSTAVVRQSSAAALLPSGRVLVAGGLGAGLGTAELYDPATATFVATGNLTSARAGLTVTVLPSGNALLFGGSPGPPAVVGATELYGTTTGKFVALSDSATKRINHTQTLLSSGNVLVTGGRIDSQVPVYEASAEVLTIVASGKACTAAASGDCESGFCVDGVCCESACAGQCEACDVAGSVGKCVPAKGPPHGIRTACVALGGIAAACGASCDGANRAACTYPAGSVRCDENCVGSTFTENTCDGSGRCVIRSPNPCENHLVCADAKTCKTKCGANSDCTPGFVCDANGVCTSSATCFDEQTSQSNIGDRQPCAPFRCDEQVGTCRTRCDSVDQCVAPNACDPSGACVPIPEDGARGCSSSPSTLHHALTLYGIAIGVLALAARRRQSRNNSRT